MCPVQLPYRGRVQVSPRDSHSAISLGTRWPRRKPTASRDSRGLDTERAMFGPPQVLTIWGAQHGSEGAAGRFPPPQHLPHSPTLISQPLYPPQRYRLAHCVCSSERGCQPQPTAQRGQEPEFLHTIEAGVFEAGVKHGFNTRTAVAMSDLNLVSSRLTFSTFWHLKQGFSPFRVHLLQGFVCFFGVLLFCHGSHCAIYRTLLMVQ